MNCFRVIVMVQTGNRDIVSLSFSLCSPDTCSMQLEVTRHRTVD